MSMNERSDIEQQVVEALLETKAVDFESMSRVFGSFAERSVREGSELSLIITKHNFWACGNPGPILQDLLQVGQLG